MKSIKILNLSDVLPDSNFKNTLKKLSFFENIVLLQTFLFNFFSIFFLALIIFEKSTRNVENSRTSLQTYLGFGDAYGQLIMFIIFIVFFVYSLIILKMLYIFNLRDNLKIKLMMKLLLPTNILILIFEVRVITNFLKIGLPDISTYQSITTFVLTDSNWAFIAIVNFAIFFITCLSSILNPVNKKVSSDLVMSISWLIPISIIQIYNINKYFLDENIYFLIFFNLINFLIYLILVKINADKARISIYSLLVLVNFTMLIAIKTPVGLYSWRPEWQYIDISGKSIFLKSIFLSLIIILPIVTKFNSATKFSLPIAALVYSFLIPKTNVLVPLTDTLHYGEKIGIWYLQLFGNLKPYSELEIHRGILVNYIPADFADFLSPGNPELFEFSFFIFSLFLGPLVYLALSKFVNNYLALLLLLFLPVPNGLVEIEFLYFSLLLLVMHYIYKNKLDAMILSIIMFLILLMVFLAPGQGIVFSLLFLTVIIFNLKQFNLNLKSHKWQITFMFTVLSGIFFVNNYNSLLSSLKWVIRTGSSNPKMYGDNWVSKLFTTDLFPSSLRWLILFSIPILLFINYLFVDKKNRISRIFVYISLIYLILMSGRWLARVDVDIPSRIGLGLIALIIFLLAPLLFNTFNEYRINISIYLTFLLLIFTLPAVYFNPLIGHTYKESAKINHDFLKSEPYNTLGEQYKYVSSVILNVLGPNASVTNLSGGTSSDFFMKIPSKGGIQSSYLIVNDDQEKEWISRLTKSNVSVFYGGYGQLGGITADQSSLSSRAPILSYWLMQNYIPFNCRGISFAVRKSEINKLKDKFEDNSCLFPTNKSEEFLNWTIMDNSLKNLHNSLLVWSRDRLINRSKIVNSKTIILNDSKNNFWNNVKIDCGSLIGQYELKLFDKENTEISHSFNATIRTGEISFDSRIFPLFNFNSNMSILSLEQAPCNFI